MDRKLLGRWGEEISARHLKKAGYTLLDLGYRCRYGEIDLIVKKGDVVAFVEVKLRRDSTFAAAREQVSAAKIERIKKTALTWLAQHEGELHSDGLQPRFDVVEIYAKDGVDTKKPEIQHIENAF